jgi:hypothetical protein
MEDDIKILNALDQNVDELLCHEALPYFVFFSMPSSLRFIKLKLHRLEKMADKFGPDHGPEVDVHSELGGKYAPFGWDLMTEAFSSVCNLRKIERK